jgi:hypothetical protein
MSRELQPIGRRNNITASASNVKLDRSLKQQKFNVVFLLIAAWAMGLDYFQKPVEDGRALLTSSSG